jgi:hypothetical protein
MKLSKLINGVGIVETEHWRQMVDGPKLAGRRAANALRRRIGIVKLGVRGLERAKLAHQRVEFCVGDFG